jgi:hypothetical protein
MAWTELVKRPTKLVTNTLAYCATVIIAGIKRLIALAH